MTSQIQKLFQSDIFSRIESANYLPHWAVLFMDMTICAVAYLFSFIIGSGIFHYGFTDTMSPIVVWDVWKQMLLLLSIQLFYFWLFHTYSGILRYSTFVDTIKVLLSVLSAGATLIIINVITAHFANIKIGFNTLVVIYVFVAFMLLFTLRVGTKTIFETIQQNAKGSRKVLIYGTKQAGIAIAKMLRSSGDTHYNPIGFIDDVKPKTTYRLLGLKVFYRDEYLISKMRNLGVRDIIISPIKMRELKKKDLAYFIENNIRILTTPYFTQWNEGEDESRRIGHIESIKIEDLLERPTINISTENVRNIIAEKVVMVTGAAGSIGSEIVRQLLTFNPKAIVLFEQAESPLHDLSMDLKDKYPDSRIITVIGDVRDRQRVEMVIKRFHPEVVYHAAAYKHVPLMENNPNEAIHANVLGTKNMADMSVKYGVKRFVMISTDKAVNPTNIMGASKRIAEIYVQSLFKKLIADNPDTTKFITTRFGNVLGSNGSVIPYFKKQIAAGGPVTVTHPDIIRYFMTIPEACCLVLEASTLGQGGEIFVFDMGSPVKILDLAKNMIRLAGYVPQKDIQIVFTGLRPGEKLFEELLNQKENTLPTPNEKIMIAKVRESSYDEVSVEIDKLIALSQSDKPFMTVEQMKKIVPEFISRNSIYEQLDK